MAQRLLKYLSWRSIDYVIFVDVAICYPHRGRLSIKYNAALEIIQKGTTEKKNGFYSHSTVCLSIAFNVLQLESLSDSSVPTRSLSIFMVNTIEASFEYYTRGLWKTCVLKCICLLAVENGGHDSG